MEKIPLTQTMFTAAPPLSHPCSFSFTTTTHHHLTISKPFNLLKVSANWVRKKKDQYHNYDTDIEEEEEEEEEEVVQEEGEIGAVGHVLMKSLKSDIPPPTIHAIPKNPTPTSHFSTRNSNEEEEDEEEEEVEVEEEKKEEERKIELSGMEVLMALQRAKSQTRSKPRRRKQKGRIHMKKGGRGKEDGNDDAIMMDVKPLNVKSDWGTRLDECEKSLQELLLHQKF